MNTPFYHGRMALRRLRRSPGFALSAVLILGLGIGSATAIFSVVRAVILQPLPFAEPERIVRLRELTPRGDSFSVSEPNFLDFEAQSRSFSDLAAVGFFSDLTLLGVDGEGDDGEAPEPARGVAVSEGLFRVAGRPPILGRTFLPEEDRPSGAARVVLLGHGLWTRRFGADPQIVGRRLRFAGGVVRTVIGVMPPGFDFPFGSELWVPLGPSPDADRGNHMVEVFGRLANGVTLQEAQQEIEIIAARLASQHAETNAGWSALLASLRESMIGGRVTRLGYVLLAAAGLLLLLACANVSSLLLAQATVRGREIALRAALGASRARIVMQLLGESLVLGFLSCGLGLLLASWGVSLVRTLPEVVPRLDEVTIDPAVLLFAVAVSMATGLVFGTAPALQASRVDLVRALQDGGRVSSREERRLRGLLVLSEVALATVLLVLAGLFGNSFRELRGADVGFDPRGVLMSELSLPEERYPEFSQQVVTFWSALTERVAALPGVHSTAGAMVTPFDGFRPSAEVIPEAGSRHPDAVVQAQWRAVAGDFFAALGIPLLSGRTFDRVAGGGVTSPREHPLEAVVSRTLARRLWGEEGVVGKRALWLGPEAELVVVGVIGDYQDVELGGPPLPVFFLSHSRIPWSNLTLVVRTEEPFGGIAEGVRREVRAIDPELAVPAVEPLTSSFDESVAPTRLSSLLMLLFAVAALIMAAAGIYALVTFSVVRRRRELGVRIALGAGPEEMVRMVLRQSSGTVVTGIAVGLAVAVPFSLALRSLLYETSPTHPLTYVAVAALLAGVGGLASYVPARAASRVDPARSLDAE